MTRLQDIAERFAPFSNCALAIGMLGLFTTTAVLLIKNFARE